MSREVIRCAIYTRVSADDQVKGNSLRQQERACRADAEQRGWEVVATFVDDGISSKVRPDDRPAFSALLSSGAQVLLAQDQDRVVRDSGHLEDLLRDHPLLRIVTRDGTDTHAGSNLVTRIKAAVAHEEREKLRLRTMRNRIEGALQGHWVIGRPPLGYKQVDKSIVQDEREVECVREIAALYLETQDANTVVQRINARGYRTRAGNQWKADAIRRVLSNDALMGTFTLTLSGATILGETFETQVFTYTAEPVLDADTYSRVQTILARSNRGRYSGREMYPLSGHVFCEHGRHFTGARWMTRKVKGYTYRGTERMYRIDAQQAGCECEIKTIKASKVEGAVRVWVTMRLLRRDTLEAIIEEYRGKRKDAVEAERALVHARKRKEALQRKQEDVFLRFEGADAERILDRIAQELASVDEKISDLAEQVTDIEVTPDELEAAITSVTGDLRDAHALQRVARALDVRVLVTAKGSRTGRRTGTIRVTGTIPVTTKSRTHAVGFSTSLQIEDGAEEGTAA